MTEYNCPKPIYGFHKWNHASCLSHIRLRASQRVVIFLPHMSHEGTKSHMIIMLVWPFAHMARRLSRCRCSWHWKQQARGHIHHTLNPFWYSQMYMAHSTDRDSARTLTRSKCTTSRHAINDLTQNGMLRFTHPLQPTGLYAIPRRTCFATGNSRRREHSHRFTSQNDVRRSAIKPSGPLHTGWMKSQPASHTFSIVLHATAFFLTDGGDRLCQRHTESEFNDKVHIWPSIEGRQTTF